MPASRSVSAAFATCACRKLDSIAYAEVSWRVVGVGGERLGL